MPRHAIGTLVALYRSGEGEAVREQFRTLKPRDETAFSAAHLRGHDRAFSLLETEEEEEAHRVSLVDLTQKGSA